MEEPEKKDENSDVYILFIVCVVLLVIIALISCILIYYYWYNPSSVDVDDDLNSVKLYKSSPESLFIYTGLNLPTELCVYKPRPTSNMNSKQLPKIYDYLRVIDITKQTNYKFLIVGYTEQSLMTEFIIFKFPTNEIVHSSNKTSFELSLEPGQYYVLLISLLNNDSLHARYEQVDDINTDDDYIVEENLMDKTQDVITAMNEKGYNNPKIYEYESKFNKYIPNFYRYKSDNIDVNEGDIIVVLLQNSQYRNYVQVTNNEEYIESNANPYINTYEIKEGGKLNVEAYTHTNQIPQKLVILVFN